MVTQPSRGRPELQNAIGCSRTEDRGWYSRGVLENSDHGGHRGPITWSDEFCSYCSDVDWQLVFIYI